jgi:hypothetical protein
MRGSIAALLALGFVVGLPAFAHAGGSMDDDEPDPDAGPAYYGFVKDANGASVADAKVTARLKGRGMIVSRTDILGVYKIPGFGKDVKPDDVEIACAKDGYQQTRVDRRPAAPDATSIETECFLKKQ